MDRATTRFELGELPLVGVDTSGSQDIELANVLSAALFKSTTAPAEQFSACLLDSIGTRQFEFAFERMLASVCGTRQYASYRRRGTRMTKIAGCLSEAKAFPAMGEFDELALRSQSDRETPRVAIVQGMALMCGWRDHSAILLFVDLEAGTPIPPGALDALTGKSSLFLAAHAKHVELLDARDGAIRALASIAQIEECLTATRALGAREVEVCARILYGLSTLGIAVDLSLSEETVRTYRKRAYQRLALGTERQLLTWYLLQWTQWHARAAGY